MLLIRSLIVLVPESEAFQCKTLLEITIWRHANTLRQGYTCFEHNFIVKEAVKIRQQHSLIVAIINTAAINRQRQEAVQV